MTTKKSIRIFTPDALSNEDYQALPQRSGSFLHRLLTHSPAKAKFGEIPSRKALDFGIWSHAMMLEPERFADAYCRDFDPSIYESIMTKGQDYKDWLKDRGMKVSGTNAELVQRILETGEPVHIEEVERELFRASLPGREFIPVADFDKIQAMRHSLMADPERVKMFAGGFSEMSIVTEEFKCRPDLITAGGWLVNYKTTLDAEPVTFGRKATDMGYPMRAVMECELFKQAYGDYPAGYAILAQEKDIPYLCKTYVIRDSSRPDDEQPHAWQLGRKQLAEAVKKYRACRDADVWPGLGGAEDLVVPEYKLKLEGVL
ncbi:exonuclease VIII [compost metagenome]